MNSGGYNTSNLGGHSYPHDNNNRIIHEEYREEHRFIPAVNSNTQPSHNYQHDQNYISSNNYPSTNTTNTSSTYVPSHSTQVPSDNYPATNTNNTSTYVPSHSANMPSHSTHVPHSTIPTGTGIMESNRKHRKEHKHKDKHNKDTKVALPEKHHHYQDGYTSSSSESSNEGEKRRAAEGKLGSHAYDKPLDNGDPYLNNTMDPSRQPYDNYANPNANANNNNDNTYQSHH